MDAYGRLSQTGHRADFPRCAFAVLIEHEYGPLTSIEAVDRCGHPRASFASKQTLFSYAHPIFWAPFAVVGDGGTTIQ